MNAFFAGLAYLIYSAFLARFFSHALLWLRASGQSGDDQSRGTALPFSICLVTALDLFFFRRLFASDKLVWPGSWLFHLAFFFVLLRHLRYFMEPVPGCITAVQPFGVFAGYLLPVSLAALLCVRLLSGKKRYVSFSNYGILSMLLLISLSGILMRNYARPDLSGVKAFIVGILTFSPQAVPSGMLFLFHFALAVLLLPYVPSHVFAAPFVSLEARRRDEALGMLMHEK